MAAAMFLDTISKLFGMVLETSGAISAYTQVKMTKDPSMLRLPKERCPQNWIIILPQRPKGSDNIEVTVVFLECGHLLAGLLWGKRIVHRHTVRQELWDRLAEPSIGLG